MTSSHTWSVMVLPIVSHPLPLNHRGDNAGSTSSGVDSGLLGSSLASEAMSTETLPSDSEICLPPRGLAAHLSTGFPDFGFRIKS